MAEFNNFGPYHSGEKHGQLIEKRLELFADNFSAQRLHIAVYELTFAYNFCKDWIKATKRNDKVPEMLKIAQYKAAAITGNMGRQEAADYVLNVLLPVVMHEIYLSEILNAKKTYTVPGMAGAQTMI